jgi:hypothetical protein
MSTLLRIVGVIWALIGAANIVSILGDSTNSIKAFAILFNMVVFVLLGLIVYGIGAGIAKRTAAAIVPAAAAPAQIPKPSIEERLKQLENMRAQGLIRPDEYEARRAAILREV